MHNGVDWAAVQKKLEASPEKLSALGEMEKTGGEPDVVGQIKKMGELLFVDCCAETPLGRRSLCYDRAALDSRKENKPAGSATEMAEEMGVDLLTEEQYRDLQTLGSFDNKTSSWVNTPPLSESSNNRTTRSEAFARRFGGNPMAPKARSSVQGSHPRSR